MALSTQEVIHNLSLGYIGEYRVEDTTASRALKQNLLCIRYFDQARDEVLASHPWNEAMLRIIIAEDAVRPIFGYDRKYSKPSASLRVVSVADDVGADVRNNAEGIKKWEVEAEKILANAGVIPQTWTTDTQYYDGEFVSTTAKVWATGTAYIDGEFVKNGSLVYEVLVDHTSDTIANDVSSANLEAGVKGSTGTYEVLTNYISSSTVKADITASDLSASGSAARIVYVRYVTQLTDITKWGPKLKQTIVMKLAIKIITGLTNDTKGKIDLINEFETLTMPKARSIDAAQGTAKPIFSSQWIRSRSSGTRGTRL